MSLSFIWSFFVCWMRKEIRNSVHCIYRNIYQKTDKECNITLSMQQFKLLHKKDTRPYVQGMSLCSSVLPMFFKLGYAAWTNPLRTKIKLNYTWRSNSYCRVNNLHLGYKNHQFMLCRKTIGVCSEMCTKCTNALCEQK